MSATGEDRFVPLTFIEIYHELIERLTAGATGVNRILRCRTRIRTSNSNPISNVNKHLASPAGLLIPSKLPLKQGW